MCVCGGAAVKNGNLPSVRYILMFEIENILEGKYKILVISDTDSNNNFTGGSFFPLKASEWFYEYPDTFQIRANWEIDVGQIEKE